MSRLRGAPVRVNARHVAQVVIAIVITTLLGVSAALFAAGAATNSEISELRAHGLRATATVTSCRGLMGGSGSNPVGYLCSGAYRIGGVRYVETVPGNALHAAGSKVAIIVSGTDPRLVSTPGILAGERASARVFIAPSILAGLAIVAVGLLAGRQRSFRPGAAWVRPRPGASGA